MPGNARRGRPQGKCHRKQTAGPLGCPARVKGCGKSAPRPRQRGRHGKPHREQNRIGAARDAQAFPGPFPGRRPGWLLEASSNGRPRGMVVASGPSGSGAQNPAYRPAGPPDFVAREPPSAEGGEAMRQALSCPQRHRALKRPFSFTCAGYPHEVDYLRGLIHRASVTLLAASVAGKPHPFPLTPISSHAIPSHPAM